MKRVLIVDASPIFKEFLKEKFSEEKIEVFFSEEQRDSITKMVSILPDLVILNINDNYNEQELLSFLQKKKNDLNASRIPMIATGPQIDKTQATTFSQYSIIKYFEKPIKFDIFFEFVGRILKVAFTLDITPCVLDIHRNNNLIFIEIAHGLNREKLALLKYRLAEILDGTGISEPKIIVMLTNIELTFVDGLNLELLLDNILSHPRISAKNVKVLSFSKFVQALIAGHSRYNGIEVTTEISQVLNSLVENSSTSSMSDLISDKILTFNETRGENSVELKFHSESSIKPTSQNISENESKIAIIDDDSVILKLMKGSFEAKGIICDVYNSGSEFLAKIGLENYKVIVLDIMMPGISGFDTLRRLQSLPEMPPVIIYSQAEKSMAIQALSLGAKFFLPKPQKPEMLIQKVMEFL